MSRNCAPRGAGMLLRALLPLAVLALASPAAAVSVFFDDFNSETGSGAGTSGQSELNYTSFANWTVSAGSVDLIFSGDFATWVFFYGPHGGERSAGG